MRAGGDARSIGWCAKNGADVARAASAQRSARQPARNSSPTVGDRVFFENGFLRAHRDRARRRSPSRRSWLSRYANYSFTIEGHADERGTREYNFALSARRADAAKSYLISRGVAASRIRTVSYGKERPVAVCDDISCWSQNRRAVTVLNAREIRGKTAGALVAPVVF